MHRFGREEETHDYSEATPSREMARRENRRRVREEAKYRVRFTPNLVSFCCTGCRFDQRSSSSLEITDPDRAAEIKQFMDTVNKGQIRRCHYSKTRRELNGIETIFKVNARPGNLMDASTILFCPIDDGDEMKYEGFKKLADPQGFPPHGEHSHLAYWCQKHHLAFRVGCLKVRWSSERGWATFGNHTIDWEMKLPFKESPFF